MVVGFVPSLSSSLPHFALHLPAPQLPGTLDDGSRLCFIPFSDETEFRQEQLVPEGPLALSPEALVGTKVSETQLGHPWMP